MLINFKKVHIISNIFSNASEDIETDEQDKNN